MASPMTLAKKNVTPLCVTAFVLSAGRHERGRCDRPFCSPLPQGRVWVRHSRKVVRARPHDFGNQSCGRRRDVYTYSDVDSRPGCVLSTPRNAGRHNEIIPSFTQTDCALSTGGDYGASARCVTAQDVDPARHTWDSVCARPCEAGCGDVRIDFCSTAEDGGPRFHQKLCCGPCPLSRMLHARTLQPRPPSSLCPGARREPAHMGGTCANEAPGRDTRRKIYRYNDAPQGTRLGGWPDWAGLGQRRRQGARSVMDLSDSGVSIYLVKGSHLPGGRPPFLGRKRADDRGRVREPTCFFGLSLLQHPGLERDHPRPPFGCDLVDAARE